MTTAIVVQMLIDVITFHHTDEPIVPSATVRWEFDRQGNAGVLGERRTQAHAARNGAEFERADHAACQAHLIRKWKRIRQPGVGWSLGPEPSAAAMAWAARKGWKVEPIP